MNNKKIMLFFLIAKISYALQAMEGHGVSLTSVNALEEDVQLLVGLSGHSSMRQEQVQVISGDLNSLPGVDRNFGIDLSMIDWQKPFEFENAVCLQETFLRESHALEQYFGIQETSQQIGYGINRTYETVQKSIHHAACPLEGAQTQCLALDDIIKCHVLDSEKFVYSDSGHDKKYLCPVKDCSLSTSRTLDGITKHIGLRHKDLSDDIKKSIGCKRAPVKKFLLLISKKKDEQPLGQSQYVVQPSQDLESEITLIIQNNNLDPRKFSYTMCDDVICPVAGCNLMSKMRFIAVHIARSHGTLAQAIGKLKFTKSPYLQFLLMLNHFKKS